MKTTVQVTGRVLLGSSFNEFLEPRLAQKLQEKPALGDWVAAIKKISTKGSGGSPEALGLPKDLRKTFKDAGREVDLGEIVKIRNELLGHGYAQDGTEEYEKAYEKCSPHIRKIEKFLQPILTCISLRHVKRAYPVDEQKACVEYQELVGDHPDIFQERKVELSLDESKLPIAERIYGRTPNDKWHDLHDSLVLQKCGECKRKRLLISDGKYYLDSYGGHRFPKPKAVR